MRVELGRSRDREKKRSEGVLIFLDKRFHKETLKQKIQRLLSEGERQRRAKRP